MKFLFDKGEMTTNIAGNQGLIDGLMTETIQSLYSRASAQIYPPSVEIFKQGNSAHEVYFIDEGLVKLVYQDQDGQELILGLRTLGWALGAASVILKKPFSVTAETLTRCHLRCLPAEVFLQFAKTDLHFSWGIHEMQSQEIQDEISRLAQLGSLTARRRLEQLFWQLISAMKPGALLKDLRLQLPLKHWEIAELIAVTPQHLSRILKQMEREGIIRYQKGRLIIHDPHRLYHASEGY